MSFLPFIIGVGVAAIVFSIYALIKIIRESTVYLGRSLDRLGDSIYNSHINLAKLQDSGYYRRQNLAHLSSIASNLREYTVRSSKP